MKNRIIAIVFFLLSPIIVFLQTSKTAVGTITELEGSVEILHSDHWDKLAPLMALYQGDVIRVLKPSQAVLVYFAKTTVTITPENSPYTVQNTLFPDGRVKETVRKLADLLNEMIGRDRQDKATLIVRGKYNTSNIVLPNDTNILFPVKPVAIRWPGGRPPFIISIFQGDPGYKVKRVYFKETTQAKIEIPVDVFIEKEIYSWIIRTTSEQWEGKFKVISKSETNSILNDLGQLLSKIPIEYPLTRAVVEGLYFLNQKLYYDAARLIESSSLAFPNSLALLQIRKQF